MPLTDFQMELGRLLARNRSEDSYLAGGAALLASPNTRRYSRDLDYFHDSAQRVAAAFESDRQTLEHHGCVLEPDITQPGYIRRSVRRGKESTKIEWAHDSAWRFMPVIRSYFFGFQLHPVDLAINKLLALAGRNEPRDFLDVVDIIQSLMDLGPLVWASAGKDPGFSPLSLLELLKRRGRLHPEDLSRLHLTEKPDLFQLKSFWLGALEDAESFVRNRPPAEVGCLYYDLRTKQFVNPDRIKTETVRHYGRPGGVLPRMDSGGEP